MDQVFFTQTLSLQLSTIVCEYNSVALVGMFLMKIFIQDQVKVTV